MKLLNKPDLIHSSNNRSYSNFININNNSNNTSIRLSSGVSHKEDKFIRINLVKKSTLPMERMKIQEKLQEYRKLIDKKMKDITRNKNSCKTHREKSSKSKSKEHSIDKNNKSNISNISALNYINYDINKKLNEMSFKSFVKEERKNKTPIKKIPINNKTQSLINFLKKNQNKIIGKNENNLNEKKNANVNKEFITQDSSKNTSNCNSKRDSLTQFIFSDYSDQKKKK
jgi:hypothetical protein